MKIYEVREWTISFCIVIGICCVFMFGLIWLNEGFKAENMIYGVRADLEKEIKNLPIINMEQRLTNLDEKLKNSQIEIISLKYKIMPSCLKGEKSSSNRP